MWTYKGENLRAKAVKEGIVEPRPLRQKSRKDRPVVVEYRWRRGFRNDAPWGPWHKWGAYTTQAAAQQMIEKKKRQLYSKDYQEFRIKETP